MSVSSRSSISSSSRSEVLLRSTLAKDQQSQSAKSSSSRRKHAPAAISTPSYEDSEASGSSPSSLSPSTTETSWTTNEDKYVHVHNPKSSGLYSGGPRSATGPMRHVHIRSPSYPPSPVPLPLTPHEQLLRARLERTLDVHNEVHAELTAVEERERKRAERREAKKGDGTPSSAPANGAFKLGWLWSSSDESESEDEHPPTPFIRSPTTPRAQTPRARTPAPSSSRPRTPVTAASTQWPVTPQTAWIRERPQPAGATPASATTQPRTPTSGKFTSVRSPSFDAAEKDKRYSSLRSPPLTRHGWSDTSVPRSLRSASAEVPLSLVGAAASIASSVSSSGKPKMKRRPTELNLTSWPSSSETDGDNISTSPSSVSASDSSPSSSSPAKSLPPSPSTLVVPQYGAGMIDSPHPMMSPTLTPLVSPRLSHLPIHHTPTAAYVPPSIHSILSPSLPTPTPASVSKGTPKGTSKAPPSLASAPVSVMSPSQPISQAVLSPSTPVLPTSPFSPSTRFCARSASATIRSSGYVSFGDIEGLGMPDELVDEVLNPPVSPKSPAGDQENGAQEGGEQAKSPGWFSPLTPKFLNFGTLTGWTGKA